MPIENGWKNSAIKISVIYIIIGSLWILSSDKILYELIQNPVLLTKFQTFKGWFFIFITAIILFLLISRDLRMLKSAQKALSHSEEQYKLQLEKTVEERTARLVQLNEKLEEEIKKQKLSEEKIQSQVEFLRTLIDTIPKPLFIKSKTRRYIDCNKAFGELFHRPKDEVIGLTAYDIFPKEVAEVNEQKDSELFNNPGNQFLEFHYNSLFGTEHYVTINKATYVNPYGALEGIIGIIEDITEYRQMQADIKIALEKEKELNSLKSRFISNASHEFRTPLTVILASADLLEMFGKNWKEEKFKEHTSKIRRTVKYMIELLDDVLTISRTETGKVTFRPENINFYNLCCEVIENVKLRKLENHEIFFSYNSPEHFLMADEKLLKQILLNLLVNSVKYSPNGGQIKFIVDINDNIASIEIADQGIGIPEENIDLLFEPFIRAENVGNIPGTGLGLSIVKRSVEMHNGNIKLKSKVNEGTTFYINIPTA
ncbi:MAG: ATP-binding protein [Bacteroidota bacterium]|nr:ATP-binding protein [Bacteroidota bacterium]